MNRLLSEGGMTLRLLGLLSVLSRTARGSIVCLRLEAGALRGGNALIGPDLLAVNMIYTKE